jgi:hypothetical protein
MLDRLADADREALYAFLAELLLDELARDIELLRPLESPNDAAPTADRSVSRLPRASTTEKCPGCDYDDLESQG